jgi:hypothetical protein
MAKMRPVYLPRTFSAILSRDETCFRNRPLLDPVFARRDGSGVHSYDVRP